MDELKKAFGQLGKDLSSAARDLNQSFQNSGIMETIQDKLDQSIPPTRTAGYKKLVKEKEDLQGRVWIPLGFAIPCFIMAIFGFSGEMFDSYAISGFLGMVLMIIFVFLILTALWIKSSSRSRLQEIQKRIDQYHDLEFEQEKARLARKDQRMKSQVEESRARSEHPFYTKARMQIAQKSSELQLKKDNLLEILTVVFGESPITIHRYQSAFETACQQASDSLAKAQLAIKTYGSEAVPTPQRAQIIQNYINQADDTIIRLNGIVDELLKVEQKQNAADLLDSTLDDLQQTTHLYG